MTYKLGKRSNSLNCSRFSDLNRLLPSYIDLLLDTLVTHKSMTLAHTQEGATQWLQALGALGTFIGVFVSFGFWFVDLRYQQAVDIVGRTIVNEEKMAPFAVSWIHGKNARTPVLFTISTIIKGGDEHVFTSSMFDQLPPNHDEVPGKVCSRHFWRSWLGEKGQNVRQQLLGVGRIYVTNSTKVRSGRKFVHPGRHHAAN